MKDIIPEEINERLEWSEPRSNSQDEQHIAYVKGIKPSRCEDCGNVPQQFRIVQTRCLQQPAPYVQHHCKGCGLYMNPTNGKYELSNQELRALIKVLNS